MSDPTLARGPRLPVYMPILHGQVQCRGGEQSDGSTRVGVVTANMATGSMAVLAALAGGAGVAGVSSWYVQQRPTAPERHVDQCLVLFFGQVRGAAGGPLHAAPTQPPVRRFQRFGTIVGRWGHFSLRPSGQVLGVPVHTSTTPLSYSTTSVSLQLKYTTWVWPPSFTVTEHQSPSEAGSIFVDYFLAGEGYYVKAGGARGKPNGALCGADGCRGE